MSFTLPFSVVVPVYNSERTLEEVYDRVANTFADIKSDFELIFVNDSSLDRSWEIIHQIKSKHPNKVIGINLRKNTGQHNALLCGFQFAKGEYVITLDDDLQFFPEDIAMMVARARESKADMVYGYYEAERQHSLYRKLGSNFVAYIFERFGNTVGQGSSFKIIHHTVIDKVKYYNHSYAFIDEILSWHTTKIDWQEVRHAPRREGQSGYSVFKLIFLTLHLVFGYTTIPLRFMTWFGLAAFWISLGFIAYFLYMKFAYGAYIGFTALISAVALSSGLILFSLGVIGEYLHRILSLQHRKPPYLVQEILR